MLFEPSRTDASVSALIEYKPESSTQNRDSDNPTKAEHRGGLILGISDNTETGTEEAHPKHQRH